MEDIKNIIVSYIYNGNVNSHVDYVLNQRKKCESDDLWLYCYECKIAHNNFHSSWNHNTIKTIINDMLIAGIPNHIIFHDGIFMSINSTDNINSTYRDYNTKPLNSNIILHLEQKERIMINALTYCDCRYGLKNII